MTRCAALRVLALVLWWGATACAAPEAQPARGPAADAVRAGIAGGSKAFDPGRWDALLRAHVDAEGRLDYAGFGKERGSLDAFLAEVARADLSSLGRPELLAVLINAYNACTVRLILDGTREGRWPASIRDLPDPWGRKLCALGGETLSLDTIEHGLLRPLFRDSRIHAAVNCASRSCPPLAPWAYRGGHIDEQLRERLESMIDSDAHVRIDERRLRLSKIFDWYAADFKDPAFLGAAPTIDAYLRRHARPERRRAIEALGPSPRIEWLDYDWSLNSR
jgi:hypothetical protein